MKPYDTCFLCGRFEPFHNGHASLVETGKKFCDRMIIFVGSAQESGTERNPFNVSTRINLIKEIYGDTVQVYGLADLTNENDITPDWGKYVLSNIDRYIFKAPDVMIYGNDEARSAWFDPLDIINTLEIIVPRGRLAISATMLREMMVRDDRKEWMKWVDPRIHKMYDLLRSELMAVPFYRKMYDDFMGKRKIYIA